MRVRKGGGRLPMPQLRLAVRGIDHRDQLDGRIQEALYRGLRKKNGAVVRGAEKAAQGKDLVDSPAFPVIAHVNHLHPVPSGPMPGIRKDIIKIGWEAADTGYINRCPVRTASAQLQFRPCPARRAARSGLIRRSTS